MKIYKATRTPDGQRSVMVLYAHSQDGQRRALNSRLDLRGHSASGFDWGPYAYADPLRRGGCLQLALAMMTDALGDDPRACCLYERFAAQWVRVMHEREFEFNDEAVRRFADNEDARDEAALVGIRQQIERGLEGMR